MARYIDADKLKNHYSWWNNENKELFDAIVDAQPTAFNLDEVVWQAQLLSFRLPKEWEGLDGKNRAVMLDDVIDLLKAGGIDAE